jgi:hypothetical protein
VIVISVGILQINTHVWLDLNPPTRLFHRLKKSAKFFGVSLVNQRKEDFNLWGFDETKQPYRRLEAALKRAGWLKKLSTIERLDNFTPSIGLITNLLISKTSTTKEFWLILYFAWTVASVDGLKKMLEGSQARYLKKLRAILDQIPSLLKKIGTVKIVVTQVREFTVCA